MSYCNFEIHDEIINEYGYIYCPFCLNGINDYVRNNRGEPCCYEMGMIFYNDKYVCNGRGPVHGYKNASEYIDNYENGYKTQKKSINQRKYTGNEVILEINIVTNKGRWKTHQIFKEFDKILLKMGIKREELTILFSENLF